MGGVPGSANTCVARALSQAGGGNRGSYGREALRIAVRNNIKWCFDELMVKAARAAARENSAGVIDVLVGDGVDVDCGDEDEDSDTPLHHAVNGGSLRSLAGPREASCANVSAVDGIGKTPVHNAAANAEEHGAAEVVDLFCCGWGRTKPRRLTGTDDDMQ